jgi:hypothetical protein
VNDYTQYWDYYGGAPNKNNIGWSAGATVPMLEWTGSQAVTISVTFFMFAAHRTDGQNGGGSIEVTKVVFSGSGQNPFTS